jgi:hypothetical protein
MKFFKGIPALTLALLLGAASVFAQSNTGRLSGTISSRDGVIPGATVTITDNQTGKEKTVVASGEGAFAVPELDAGNYTVRITAPGFKTFTATAVKIDVAREYSLNATLEAGDVKEEVTVVAGADVLNATNAEVSNTVSPRQIQELPLNGRNPLQLIQLQAGTSSNGATNTAINGQRTSFTNITRDGINIQDNFIRSNATDFAPERPGVDDVSEFTLTSSNADASQGYGASQVQLVTPRGTSQFHGALFEYNRNSEFSSNPFFNNASGTRRPFLNRNQFGGKLGGPLPLPRFGEGGPSLWRNKGFFFVEYEGFRQRQQTTALTTILLPQARTGVFTYVDNAGVTRQINLLTSFGSRFGVTGVNPLVQSRILSQIPTAGNTTDAGDQRNTTGYRLNARNNVDRDHVTMRYDVDANERHSFNLVYTHGTETNDRPDVDIDFLGNPLVVQPAPRDLASAAWRWTPSSNFTSSLHGGFFKQRPTFNRVLPEPSFFLSIPLVSNPEGIGTLNFQNQGRQANNYTVADDASYIRGNHTMRFGGTWTLFTVDSFAKFTTIPQYTLGTNTTTGALSGADFTGGISATQLATANSLLALLGGITSSVTQTFNAATTTSGFVPGATNEQRYRFNNDAAYFTDQWRFSPRLTLNLGLRYDIYPALREVNGFGLEPVLGNVSSLADVISVLRNPTGTVNFVGTNAGGHKFYKTDKNNFAPVVSFAWSPQFKNNFLGSVFGKEGRTVIRGGYSINYVNDEFVRGPDNAQTGNAGLSTSRSISTLNDRLGGNLTPITTPAFGIPRSFAQGNALSGINFGTIFAVDPNLSIPMAQQWNFGIQREIGFQTALEVRYVGGKSDNLVRGVDLNEVNIFENGFLADFNRARANLVQFGAAGCTAAQAAATGCQQLTVFPTLPNAGLLTNATIINQLRAGTPADLAVVYIQNFSNTGTNGLTASQFFLPNPNAGAIDLLANGAKYRYHSLQAELRRRFASGFYFQANYTFQKTLTNASGVGQTDFEPLLTSRLPQLEYARADYDTAHVFNFNTIYELPFGRGKRWLTGGGVSDRVFGGWQVTSIIRASTGAPITIIDPRGTFNRAGRSGRQTANTSLTNDQVKKLVGVFKTPCGVYYINPAVININHDALAAGNCSQLTGGSFTGQGSLGFGQATFPGQAFFNVAPGQVGNMARAFLNGPAFFNWDASVIKNVRITENTRLQLRAEGFNILNRANFFFTQLGTNANINSTTFGRINSTFTSSGAQRVVQFAARFEF